MINTGKAPGQTGQAGHPPPGGLWLPGNGSKSGAKKRLFFWASWWLLAMECPFRVHRHIWACAVAPLAGGRVGSGCFFWSDCPKSFLRLKANNHPKKEYVQLNVGKNRTKRKHHTKKTKKNRSLCRKQSAEHHVTFCMGWRGLPRRHQEMGWVNLTPPQYSVLFLGCLGKRDCLCVRACVWRCACVCVCARTCMHARVCVVCGCDGVGKGTSGDV